MERSTCPKVPLGRAEQLESSIPGDDDDDIDVSDDDDTEIVRSTLDHS
jgi:hypothetical protein